MLHECALRLGLWALSRGNLATLFTFSPQCRLMLQYARVLKIDRKLLVTVSNNIERLSMRRSVPEAKVNRLLIVLVLGDFCASIKLVHSKIPSCNVVG